VSKKTDRPVAEAVAERILAAPKYRFVHADTVTDIVRREAAFASDAADLEQRARRKLHKVTADYLLTVRPARALRGLPEAAAAGPDALRAWCRELLSRHFSTAERLPFLDELYPAIFELTGPAASIADLACALNPFTLPWLRDVSQAAYTGHDLNLAYVDLGTQFFELCGLEGTVEHRDVLVAPEQTGADVALLLKIYHCIEDRRPGAALRLVEDVPATRVVVSFPLVTMTGRAIDFRHGHIEQLHALAERRGWLVRGTTFAANEELVVITKRAKATADG